MCQEKYIWKRPLPIPLSHISANIIGIYLQTFRSQIRLLLKEQPNTDPQRSTENGSRGDIFRLLIALANSFDSDQDRQNVGLDRLSF